MQEFGRWHISKNMYFTTVPFIEVLRSKISALSCKFIYAIPEVSFKLMTAYTPLCPRCNLEFMLCIQWC